MEDLPGDMLVDQQYSLLQTALITQFKYIENYVYSAKDPHWIAIFPVILLWRPNVLSQLASWMLEKLYALGLNEICVLTYSICCVEKKKSHIY